MRHSVLHQSDGALQQALGDYTDTVIELLRPDHAHLATREDLALGVDRAGIGRPARPPPLPSPGVQRGSSNSRARGTDTAMGSDTSMAVSLSATTRYSRAPARNDRAVKRSRPCLVSTSQ